MINGVFGKTVNISGSEVGALPGTYGTTYVYPSSDFLKFVKTQGIQTVVIPFMWERWQPTLGAALDSTESTRIREMVAAAKLNGLKVILKCNNQARYLVSGVSKYIDQVSGPTTANLSDLWARIANIYEENETVVGYAIMHQPHDVVSAAAWNTIAQSVVDAIRYVDEKTYVIVGGYKYSQAKDWFFTEQTTPWIDSNRVIYEVDQGLDNNDALVFGGTYAQAVTKAVTDGFVAGSYVDALTNKTITQLKAVLDWSYNNNVNLIIGHTGVNGRDAQYLTLWDLYLKTIRDHKADVSIAPWAASELLNRVSVNFLMGSRTFTTTTGSAFEVSSYGSRTLVGISI